MVDSSSSDVPALPAWLARAMPFTRRMHLAAPRIHYVDEGEGRPVLLVHGNPTWSFLWRKIIGPLARSGRRVIAPDLFGFGLSEKPRLVSAHSLQNHIDRIVDLVTDLDLRELTVVGQDWGGPIAAGVAHSVPERTHAAVFANTAVLTPARPFRPKTFQRFSHLPLVSDLVFRGFAFPVPVMPFAQGDRGSIGLKELLAYAWPFKNPLDRAGPLALARMVPNSEDHPSTPVMDEIGHWASGFTGPMGLVWGQRDPILGRGLKRHREAFPQARVIETEAGHFLQEEVPDDLVRAILYAAG